MMGKPSKVIRFKAYALGARIVPRRWKKRAVDITLRIVSI